VVAAFANQQISLLSSSSYSNSVVGQSFVFFLMPTLFPFPLPEATNAVVAIAFLFLGAIV
jgi:hypothetical protein